MPHSPFLCALHHELLVGCDELELGRVLPHTLQPLPHRGHVSAGPRLFTCTDRIVLRVLPIYTFMVVLYVCHSKILVEQKPP